MTDPQGHQTPPHRRALAEAYQQAIQSGAGPSEPAAPPPGRSLMPRAVLALILAALLGWFILSPPAWLQGPKVSPERAEASARLALYLQARRIDRFAADSGHLPATLAAVGPVLPDIQYRMTGEGGYQLILETPRLVYHSASGPESFLGNAMEVLNGKDGRQ